MSFLLFFTPYVNALEWRVARFMKRINERSDRLTVEKQLLTLMQENLVTLNLWLEKKYKNYVYLKKNKRRKLYDNLAKIEALFADFSLELNLPYDQVKKELISQNLTLPPESAEQILHLKRIMLFLAPGRLYLYEAQANFGRLLADPAIEKLIGDCNQIVTLYTYFYSRRFPVSDLQIKILPKHVCLHYKGIDIEATNGTFTYYREFQHLLPITEIISTNLLDVSDVTAKQAAISAESLLQASKLAYVISSMQDLVAKNLQIAYRNCGAQALKNNNFETALFCFQKINDPELIKLTYYNGAIYYAKHDNFNQATFYAEKSQNLKLTEKIKEQEGYYNFQKNNFTKAVQIFQHLGNETMVNACYKQELYLLGQKVKHVKTVQEAKAYRSTYYRMAELAEKAKLYEFAKQYREILRKK